MKKILFIVLTHGNETAGLELFLNHSYGKTDKVEWEVVIGNPEASWLQIRFLEENLNRICANPSSHDSYEGKRAQLLQKKMQDFDVVYDIHTTSFIKDTINDCVFINSLDSLEDTHYAHAKNVIHDSTANDQYVTSLHPNGITLEYTKTANIQQDRERILADFKAIINQKKVSIQKNLLEFAGLISQTQAQELSLDWRDFQPISAKDIKQLNLTKKAYLPIFVNPIEKDAEVYAAVNLITNPTS